MAKRCGRCGLTKPESDFHKRKSKNQSWCKECRKEYDAEYWRRTRVDRLRKRRKRRRALLDWYRSLKAGRACTDCGRTFHHAAMQWDHLPGATKRWEVSNMVRRGFRRETILEEIARCDLVCANCHAVRTFTRYGV